VWLVHGVAAYIFFIMELILFDFFFYLSLLCVHRALCHKVAETVKQSSSYEANKNLKVRIIHIFLGQNTYRRIEATPSLPYCFLFSADYRMACLILHKGF
jgi:hypothetical protein